MPEKIEKQPKNNEDEYKRQDQRNMPGEVNKGSDYFCDIRIILEGCPASRYKADERTCLSHQTVHETLYHKTDEKGPDKDIKKDHSNTR